jgi:hypothetical protein
MSIRKINHQLLTLVTIAGIGLFAAHPRKLDAAVAGVKFLRSFCNFGGTTYNDCNPAPGSECCSIFHACIPDCSPMG